MKKLDSITALKLLYKDVIFNGDDLKKEENRWVKHCLFVGIAAGRIAEKLGLDSDYAISLGYIHDIGRKISHSNHAIEGFKYMIENGYIEEARSCLTHSFIDNNIYYTAGGLPEGNEKFNFFSAFLQSSDLTMYDNIVQMCDLFCLETGFTTIERRLLDITERKGVFDNSHLHLEKTFELKRRLESKIDCSLYSLFPEIDEYVLAKIDDDHKKLVNLISGNLIGSNKKLLKK